MKFPNLAYSLLFCGLLFMRTNTHAEPALSLAEAIELATANQPLLQSLDDAAASIREAAIAESQLSDPKLKFGVINLPVTTSDALRYNRDDQTMVNVGIAQEVIPFKKRELAANKMLAEADQFQTEQTATRRIIERDVALAWLDVYEAQRKSELILRLLEELAAERKIAATTISTGGATTSDVLRMDTEVLMTNEKRIFAQRDERKARAALARWIGQAANRAISSELPVMNSDLDLKTVAMKIERHPQLLNALQSEKVAQLEVDSARANLERNWGWELGYGKRFADRSDMLSIQISMDLQVNRANRQDRRTAEKLVLVEKYQKLTEDKKRELSAELEAAIADAQAAAARENIHLTSLIPNAKARLSIAQAAYSTGKEALDAVWNARKNVIEVELDHWAILTDRQRAAVKIGYLLNDSRLFKPF